MEGLADLLLGEIEDGLAGGALVAGGLERVERQRIILGRGDLFLHQSAEDADLVLREVHTYKGATDGIGGGSRMVRL